MAAWLVSTVVPRSLRRCEVLGSCVGSGTVVDRVGKGTCRAPFHAAGDLPPTRPRLPVQAHAQHQHSGGDGSCELAPTNGRAKALNLSDRSTEYPLQDTQLKILDWSCSRACCQKCSGRGATRCGSCGAMGRRPCGFCGGSGGRMRSTRLPRPSAADKTVTRWVPCGCGGGRIPCSTCSGSGSRRCEQCPGNGEVHVIEQRRRRFWAEIAQIWSAGHTRVTPEDVVATNPYVRRTVFRSPSDLQELTLLSEPGVNPSIVTAARKRTQRFRDRIVPPDSVLVLESFCVPYLATTFSYDGHCELVVLGDDKNGRRHICSRRRRRGVADRNS
jgi:hypothetical protein